MLHYHYIRKVRKTMNQYHYEVGDIVKLKKQHPCGSSEWEILRVGADFRLKCTGCGHQIMIARKLVEKNTKGLRKAGDRIGTLRSFCTFFKKALVITEKTCYSRCS